MTWQLSLGYSDDISHLLSYELVYRIFITLSTLPLNYSSDIINYLLSRLETVMLIWCSIQGVYFEIEAEKYPQK